MEIITPTKINLEALIESTFADWDMKQQLILLAKDDADKQAYSILKAQFQSNLNDVLSSELQALLNIEVVQTTHKNIFATFSYLGVVWNIYRIFKDDGIYWNLANDNVDLICFPDNFQKQLLIELGRVKASISISQ